LGSGRLPLFRGGRPLKRWRYVGVFCEEFMACAAVVQVGPAKQTFWAVLWRADARLREHTHLVANRNAVRLHPGRLQINDDGLQIDLALAEDNGWEAQCSHGRQEVWTRKQAGVAACGTIALDGAPPRRIEALAVIDDTAGYHARVTEWWWAAGVGRDRDGRALAFNLVEGVNDPQTGSERAVWIEGHPSEPGPVRFARDLSEVHADDGSTLRFTPEATRSRHENLLVLKSDYRAPFGTFSGALPGGIELAHGLGVVEHHRARW
jgi:hypothetical protein